MAGGSHRRRSHEIRPQPMKKALSIYLMCGRDTPALAAAAVEGGADLLELGFPFSDPLADGPVLRRAGGAALLGPSSPFPDPPAAGPVVRRAGERALAAGMRTSVCHDVLRETRSRV